MSGWRSCWPGASGRGLSIPGEDRVFIDVSSGLLFAISSTLLSFGRTFAADCLEKST